MIWRTAAPCPSVQFLVLAVFRTRTQQRVTRTRQQHCSSHWIRRQRRRGRSVASASKQSFERSFPFRLRLPLPSATFRESIGQREGIDHERDDEDRSTPWRSQTMQRRNRWTVGKHQVDRDRRLVLSSVPRFEYEYRLRLSTSTISTFQNN